MAKKSEALEEVAALQAQIAVKDKVIKAAQQGLFRIIDIAPERYISGPIGSGQTSPLVKAFRECQSVADRTVIAMADAEVSDADN